MTKDTGSEGKSTQIDCPVCGLDRCRRQADARAGPARVTCWNCGEFLLPDTTGKVILGRNMDAAQRAALSHAVWKMQRQGSLPTLYSMDIDRLAQMPLPTPAEQADLAVLWFGDDAKDPAAERQVRPAQCAAKMGAIGEEGVTYVLGHLDVDGLLEIRGWEHGRPATHRQKGEPLKCRLSFAGWHRYEELGRGRADTSKVFMAMPFSGTYAELVQKAYRSFQVAVAEAGFHLVNGLLEAPKAGLIDDHLRVEIRTARFLIADLTGGNQGAYWEAGFGEGLGKTVIYTCQKGFFDAHKTHFDTNHCQTVIWHEEELEEACTELKGVIRNTFPGEAKMVDDGEEEPGLGRM